MKDFRLAVCQVSVTDDKGRNIDNAERMIRKAVENGAQMVVLPEIFNSPYDTRCFSKYSEVFPGQTSSRMMNLAKELRDRKSTRLNSSHANISYAVFCLKKKKLFIAS